MGASRNVLAGSRALSLFVLAAGSAISAHATAQPATVGRSGGGSGGGDKSEEQLRGSYAQPLGAGGRASREGRGSGDTTNVVMIENRDGDTYTLKINGGTISAEHNGQAVPPERIERKGGAVLIKDKDGKTIKTFDVGVIGEVRHGDQGADGRVWWLNHKEGLDLSALQGLGEIDWEDGQGSKGRGLVMVGGEEDPPPVMVGITMSDVDSSVLEHLNLDEGSAFSIDRVVEGLPAEKGGLKPHDVVTAIDGQTPATQEKFREVLRGKKAGDRLELKITRHGKAETVTLDLVAYDASKLGTTRGRVLGVPFGSGGEGGPGEAIFEIGRGGTGAAGGWSGEARKTIEQALAELKNNPNLQPEKIKAESQRALEEALKAISQTQDVFRQRWQSYRDGGPGGPLGGGGRADVFVAPNEAQPFVRMRPQVRAEGDEPSIKHLERLNAQLDRLNKRLDELEKRLEKSDDHK